MIVREIKGCYHCITLSDKTTLRLFPRKTVEVADALVSKEIHDLEDEGEVMLSASPKKAPVQNNDNKEGGKK